MEPTAEQWTRAPNSEGLDLDSWPIPCLKEGMAAAKDTGSFSFQMALYGRSVRHAGCGMGRSSPIRPAYMACWAMKIRAGQASFKPGFMESRASRVSGL